MNTRSILRKAVGMMGVMAVASVVNAAGPAAGRIIVFERENSVWIADAQGRHQRRICAGLDPDVSPDGKMIACTVVNTDGERFIGVVEISSPVIRQLDAVPGTKSFGPRWSPDGTRLVFSHYGSPGKAMTWGAGIINADNTGFTVVSRGDGDLFSPVWTPDGTRILSHDRTMLYTIGTEGDVYAAVPLSSLVPAGLFSSAARVEPGMAPGSFAIDAGYPGESMKGMAEPPAALYLAAKDKTAARRLSPPGLSAGNPCWQAENRILFDGFAARDIREDASAREGISIRRSIYRVRINDGVCAALIKNARCPSFAPR